MSNLLRFAIELATDVDARQAFRADPEASLSAATPRPGLTGEDVDAVLALVRRTLGPPTAERIVGGSPSGTATDEDPADAVLRHLAAMCDAVDAPADERPSDGGSFAMVHATPDPDALDPDVFDPNDLDVGHDDPDVFDPGDLDTGSDDTGDGGSAPIVAAGGGEPLADHPPGERPHLWAVIPEGDDDDDGPDHAVDETSLDDHGTGVDGTGVDRTEERGTGETGAGETGAGDDDPFSDLWAMSGDDDDPDTGDPETGDPDTGEYDESDTVDPADFWQPTVDPSHPSAGGHGLSAVPDPDEGYRFDPLELVRLPDGLAEADIEPGVLATIVAVHDDELFGLRYEIEVAHPDGSRRFLGVVDATAVGRAE